MSSGYGFRFPLSAAIASYPAVDYTLSAVDDSATAANESLVDFTRSHQRDADWDLSSGAAGYSRSSLHHRAIFDSHDGWPLGADGPPCHLDVLGRSEFYPLGHGAVWRGPISELALSLMNDGQGASVIFYLLGLRQVGLRQTPAYISQICGLP